MVHPLGHAERVEIDPGILLVENTQHDALARAARQGRDAHVEQFAAERQPHAPVLRHAALGDVEPRHHLDAADHHRRDMRRHAQRFAQHAVDPHPDDQPGLIGLDMDIADIMPRGIGDHPVDQPDRGGIIGGVEQILGGRDAVRQQVELVAHADRGERGRLPVHRVGVAEQPVERGFLQHLDIERAADDAPHLDQRRGIGAVAQRDALAVEDHPEAARKGIRQLDRRDDAGERRILRVDRRQRRILRRGGHRSFPRLITVLELRCTGTLTRGSSMLPGTGADGIGGAAPI